MQGEFAWGIFVGALIVLWADAFVYVIGLHLEDMWNWIEKRKHKTFYVR